MANSTALLRFVQPTETATDIPVMLCTSFRLTLLLALLVVVYAAEPSASVNAWLDLTSRTIALVERAQPRPKLAQRLEALRARAKADPGPATIDAILAFRREVLWSHPALAFNDLICVAQSPADPYEGRQAPSDYSPRHMGDRFYGRTSHRGSLLVIHDWKGRPFQSSIAGSLPPGGFANPDISFDGKRVVVAYCDHTPADPQMRSYRIVEADLGGSGVRQITGTSADPMLTRWERKTQLIEDYMPLYLPDGGFVFTSTRNMTTVRCANSQRYNPSFLLYRCNTRGSDVRPLSYGELNEYPSSILPDGRILFTRWEYINREITTLHSLWATGTDGSRVQHVYGTNTIDPNLIIGGRPIPGSRRLVATASAHHNVYNGTIILVDPAKGEDGFAPLTLVTPERSFPESYTSQVMKRFPTVERDQDGLYPFGLPYRIDDISPMSVLPKPVLVGHGDYLHPYPLSEDHFLVSHKGPGEQRFSLWLIDSVGGRELIWSSPEAMDLFFPLPVQPRECPHVLPPPPPQVSAKVSETGLVLIGNVYHNRCDPTGRIARGSVTALRVNQILDQPTTRAAAVSRVVFETPKRILGTVPVEPDGSVSFRAPAGVPLQFQLLDAKGMAVMGMRTFVYLQPGQVMSCIGCHESPTEAPIPTASRQRPQFPDLIRKPWHGNEPQRGLSFDAVVQPVLDRNCISCHGLGPAAPSLLGTREKRKYPTQGVVLNWPHSTIVPASTGYLNLLEAKGMVAIAQMSSERCVSVPFDYYAHAGRLIELLDAGHQGVHLDSDERQRLVDWLDVNAQFAGSYSWNRPEMNGIDPSGEQDLRAFLNKRLPALSAQPIAALVNTTAWESSRVLLAPLSIQAGGWGLVEGGWRNNDDPDYRTVQDLVQKTVRGTGFQDVDGTCGRGPNQCICGSCREREGLLRDLARRNSGDSQP